MVKGIRDATFILTLNELPHGLETDTLSAHSLSTRTETMVEKLLRCKHCGKYGIRTFHRCCRRDWEILSVRALDCMEERSIPESERWTVLIEAVRSSEIVTKRGVAADVLLERLYDTMLESWYRKADAGSFVQYRDYLDAFRDQVKIKIDGPGEKYRRLTMLHQLQKTFPDPINEDLLIASPNGTRDYVKAVCQTSKMWQIHLGDVSVSRGLNLVGMLLAPIGGWSILGRIGEQEFGIGNEILFLAIVFCFPSFWVSQPFYL